MIRRGEWDVLIIEAMATSDQTFRAGPKPEDLYHRRQGEVLLPDREPQDVLDQLRFAIGSMNFAAQYQQNPIPPGGNVIQRSWLKFYDEEPAEFDHTVASWDTASTIGERSSYSVGQLWGSIGEDFYLLEQVRDRWETPFLRRMIIDCAESWRPRETYVEDTELGRSLIQDIRRTTDLRIERLKPQFDKVARLLQQSSRFEAGRVYLPQNAPWLGSYTEELLAAPFGRYWDQVDATTQALYVLVARTASQRPLVRSNPVRRTIVRRLVEDLRASDESTGNTMPSRRPHNSPPEPAPYIPFVRNRR